MWLGPLLIIVFVIHAGVFAAISHRRKSPRHALLGAGFVCLASAAAVQHYAPDARLYSWPVVWFLRAPAYAFFSVAFYSLYRSRRPPPRNG